MPGWACLCPSRQNQLPSAPATASQACPKNALSHATRQKPTTIKRQDNKKAFLQPPAFFLFSRSKHCKVGPKAAKNASIVNRIYRQLTNFQGRIKSLLPAPALWQ